MERIPLFELLDGDPQRPAILPAALVEWIEKGGDIHWRNSLRLKLANEEQLGLITDSLHEYAEMNCSWKNPNDSSEYRFNWKFIYEDFDHPLVCSSLGKDDYQELLNLIDSDGEALSTTSSPEKSTLTENAQKAANARHKKSRAIKDILLVLLIPHRNGTNIRAAELLRPEIRELMGKKENDKGPTVETIAKWIGKEKAKAKKKLEDEAKKKATP